MTQVGETTPNINITGYIRVSKSTWRQAAIRRWQRVHVCMEGETSGDRGSPSQVAGGPWKEKGVAY